jgi:hypothetical protein
MQSSFVLTHCNSFAASFPPFKFKRASVALRGSIGIPVVGVIIRAADARHNCLSFSPDLRRSFLHDLSLRPLPVLKYPLPAVSVCGAGGLGCDAVACDVVLCAHCFMLVKVLAVLAVAAVLAVLGGIRLVGLVLGLGSGLMLGLMLGLGSGLMLGLMWWASLALQAQTLLIVVLVVSLVLLIIEHDDLLAGSLAHDDLLLLFRRLHCPQPCRRPV